MATTRTKPPAAKDLYEEDFYVWAERQAALLRARRFEDLDLDNLIEEVADLGGALKRSVRSRIRTIMEHLLKLQHSPAQNPRGGWYDPAFPRCGGLQLTFCADSAMRISDIASVWRVRDGGRDG